MVTMVTCVHVVGRGGRTREVIGTLEEGSGKEEKERRGSERETETQRGTYRGVWL